jgi:hypothetical protein
MGANEVDAELLALIGFREDEITARVSEQSKSEQKTDSAETFCTLRGGKLRYTTRLDLSSALSGSLREKRLELRYNPGAVAVRALNALLFVLTDRHRKGETLVTLLAKIFVERHINSPLLLDSLWLRQLNLIVPRSHFPPEASSRRWRKNSQYNLHCA